MRSIHHKTTKPPTVKYTSDNLALLPASLLPFRNAYRQLAATLPSGEVLMVVPSGSGQLRSVMRALSPALRARGRHITAISAHRTPRHDMLGLTDIR